MKGHSAKINTTIEWNDGGKIGNRSKLILVKTVLFIFYIYLFIYYKICTVIYLFADLTLDYSCYVTQMGGSVYPCSGYCIRRMEIGGFLKFSWYDTGSRLMDATHL